MIEVTSERIPQPSTVKRVTMVMDERDAKILRCIFGQLAPSELIAKCSANSTPHPVTLDSNAANKWLCDGIAALKGHMNN